MLLLVIIGVALLAFILGDFFTSGRTFFGTGTTIAKVGGQKIEIHQFQRKVEEASRQYQQTGQKIDQSVLQQQVLSQMVTEALYQQELNDLGLVVTDAELSDAMLGSGSMLTNRIVQQQVGVESASQLHDMAYNPVKYGLEEAQAMQLRQYWVELEKQIEQQLLQAKFQNLFAGTLVANQLDAKALYDENATTAKFAYARKDFSSLPDNQFEVSDAEIQQEWQKNKAAYAIPEQNRNIRYIAVNINPSADDRLAAQQKVETALTSLKNEDGVEGVQSMSEFVVDRQKATLSSIRDAKIRNFADSASVGSASLISQLADDYTLAKLLGKSNEIDSVNVTLVGVTGSRAVVDSIITALNNGAKLADLANNPAVQQQQDSLWVSLVNPNMAELRDVLATVSTGKFFTPDTASVLQGARILRVNRRRNPVPVVDLAVVTFTSEPSNATINSLESALINFVNTNSDAKSFVENASEAGYTAIPATISASTSQINRMDDSRDAIAWAMKAKKGSVSPVFGDQQTGRFIVVALENIYDDYVPATDPMVKSSLAIKVRNDKKANALLEQFSGKANNIEGYAQLMETSVDTTTATFGQTVVPKFGVNRSEIAARVASAEKGKLLGPVKDTNSVLVMQVIEVDDQGRPYNFEESANNFSRTRGSYMLGNRLPMILQGNQKITNNMYEFFGNR